MTTNIEKIADYHTLIYRAKQNKIKGYSKMNKAELVNYLESKEICCTVPCKKKRNRKEDLSKTEYQIFISNELKNNKSNITQQQKMKEAAQKWREK